MMTLMLMVTMIMTMIMAMFMTMFMTMIMTMRMPWFVSLKTDTLSSSLNSLGFNFLFLMTIESSIISLIKVS